MIHLISKDLRKEEVYVQIADCLDYLEKITGESFTKVNGRLKSMNDDLVKLERRREIVEHKIEQIKSNNNKAIQVFSPFYYPAKRIKDEHKYESLIECSQSKKLDKTPYEFSVRQQPDYAIQQPLELFHPDDLNDHLNFLDLETFLQTERESLTFLQRQKLNKSNIPWNRIKSISSLIIFNSSEISYLKSDQDSSIYEFKTTSKQKKNEEGDEFGFGNMAPPKSMTKREKVQFDFEQNLFKLDTQEAPEVLDSLPNDLPDLGAVADDIFFNDDSSMNIPSIKINQKSTVEQKEAENKQLPSKMFRIFSFDQSSTSSIEEIKPVAEAKVATNHQIDVANTIPPMPPPLPVSASTSFESTEIEKPVEKNVQPTDNSRANLLDAIRQAAGRPDKSRVTIKEKKLEERKNRKEAVSTDLMSDLKKHLMSRRQAMTGTKFTNHQQDNSRQMKKDQAENVYSRMNSMIPSPAASSVQSSESDVSDDDWVNNN